MRTRSHFFLAIQELFRLDHSCNAKATFQYIEDKFNFNLLGVKYFLTVLYLRNQFTSVS